MIQIIEKIPKKIPGESSLFVSFEYNAAIVAVIKTCTPAHYDKKSKVWEIPLTRLAKFVNGVYHIDEIDIKLKKQIPKNNIEYKLSKFKTNPYKYQQEGIQFGLNNDSFLLLDAPGLGKTLQMIYLAEELKKRDGIKHCLIVCGINTLKTNWEKEIKKHSKLDCVILGKKITKTGKVWYDGNKARTNQLKHKINEFFIITNIEALRDDEFLAALKNGPNAIDMVVVDEIHTCFVGSTQVIVDNEVHTIEEVVEKNIGTHILSHDFNIGIDDYKLIEDKHRYDYCGRIVTFRIQSEDGKEVELKVTPDHLIFTHNRGYVKAIDITEEDILEINCI